MPAASSFLDKLRLDQALLILFGAERRDKVYSIAAAFNDDPADMLCDLFDTWLSELTGPPEPLAVASAINLHRLLTRSCEPIATELPCDCEAAE